MRRGTSKNTWKKCMVVEKISAESHRFSFRGYIKFLDFVRVVLGEGTVVVIFGIFYDFDYLFILNLIIIIIKPTMDNIIIEKIILKIYLYLSSLKINMT